MNTRQTPAIEVSGLVKTFGSLRAADGLDLTVEAGQVHGFLGPNGAGKSTTIRVLLGMYRRDGGLVRVLGLDPARNAREITRRTAYVPGDIGLWPALTGGQTLDALAALRGGRDLAREAELIEAFRLDPSKPVRSYSKGNRQKVVLVAALAAPCELLVLDEPTSGLDPLQEEVFQDAVGWASRHGRTVLLSSHVLAEVENLCETVTIVKDGRTVETGPLAQLRHLSATRVSCRLPSGQLPAGPAAADPPSELPGSIERARDGRVVLQVSAEDVPQALRRLVDVGAQEITCTPARLEDLFLRHYEASAR